MEYLGQIFGIPSNDFITMLQDLYHSCRRELGNTLSFPVGSVDYPELETYLEYNTDDPREPYLSLQIRAPGLKLKLFLYPFRVFACLQTDQINFIINKPTTENTPTLFSLQVETPAGSRLYARHYDPEKGKFIDIF